MSATTIGIPLLTGSRDELADRWMKLADSCADATTVLIACRAARYRLLRDLIRSAKGSETVERRVVPIENDDDLSYFLRLCKRLHIDRLEELTHLDARADLGFPLAVLSLSEG